MDIKIIYDFGSPVGVTVVLVIESGCTAVVTILRSGTIIPVITTAGVVSTLSSASMSVAERQQVCFDCRLPMFKHP